MGANREEQDASLSGLMREWRLTDPLPPRFRENVWARIARAETRPKATLWSALKDWFEAPLPRPAVAFAYVAALMAMGIANGYWQGQQQAGRMDEALGMRYLTAINPYQAPASHQ